MGNPISTTISAGDDVLASQLNNVRTDALQPSAWTDPDAVTDFARLQRPVDLLNGLGNFEEWQAGINRAPTGWSLSTTSGFAVERTNDAESGSYAAKLTNSSSSGQYMRLRLTSVRYLRGRSLTITSRVKIGSGTWALEIADDSGTTTGANITSASYTQYNLSRDISASATYVEIRLKHVTAAGSATFEAVAAYLGRIVWSGGIEPTNNLLSSGIQRTLLTAYSDVGDVVVYSPSKDDTIGSWTERCAYTSWYTDETLTPTDGQRGFPDPAIIVRRNGASGSLSILDQYGNLWMAFDQVGTTDANESAIGRTATYVGLDALNGRIYMGSNNGLTVVDFIEDEVYRVRQQWTYRFRGSIATRNSGLGIVQAFGKASATATDGIGLTSSDIRGVATRVIAGKTVSAVATADGLCIIKWDENQTILLRESAGENTLHPRLTDDGTCFWMRTTATSTLKVKDAVHMMTTNIDGATTGIRIYARNAYSSAGPTGASYLGTIDTNSDLALFEHSNVTGFPSHSVALATTGGVTVINDNPLGIDRASAKLYTTTYVTDSMYGKIHGMWDTSNMSTTASNNLPDRGPRELHMRGVPAFVAGQIVAGVRGNAVDFNGTTQYAQITPITEYALSNGDTDQNIMGTAKRVGQGFQVTKNCKLSDVIFKMKKAGSAPVGNIRLRIMTDNSGVPSSTVVDSFVELPLSALTASYQNVRFHMNGPTSLVAGTQYHFELANVSGGVDVDSGTDYPIVYTDNTTPLYGSGAISTYNGTTWTAGGTDVVFEAYVFDQAGQSSQPGEFTVGTWVYMDSVTGVREIINRWNDSPTPLTDAQGWHLLFDGSKFKFEAKTNGGVTFGKTSNITPGTGLWYHVAAVYDASAASTTLDIYVNGRKDNGTASGSIGAFLEGDGPPIRLGVGRTGFGETDVNFLDGRITHPFITPVALTAEQIRKMYESGQDALAAAGVAASNTQIAQVIGGGTDNSRCVGIYHNGMVIGTNNGAGAGGVSVMDLKSDARIRFIETPGTASQADADKSGNTWTGAGADDIKDVSVRHGILGIASAFFYIDHLVATAQARRPNDFLPINLGCRLTYNANQASGASGVDKTVLWNTRLWDNGEMFNPSVNTGYVTVRKAGIYHAVANVEWGSTGANAPNGLRQVVLFRNTTAVGKTRVNMTTADAINGITNQHISATLRLAAGDQVSVVVTHTQTTTVPLLNYNDEFSPVFSIVYIGPS